jgi:ribosomal protein S18 acetylase RimI-like enzyme
MVLCNVTGRGVSSMVVDLGHGFYLRHAEATDHAALLSVCLKTGDSGDDATHIEDAPDLVGMIYAVPYQVLEPEFCFVVEDKDGICGYAMGTPDTVRFDKQLAGNWFPQLQARVSAPPSDSSRWKGSDWVRDKIYHPVHVFPESLQPFPAHGHIDLLPRARGKGVGRAAMSYLMDRLFAAGAPGIHLHVALRNLKAQAFYKTLGFNLLQDQAFPDHTVFMAKSLT